MIVCRYSAVTSPFRRKSSKVRSSSRFAVLVPDLFSERIVVQPARDNRFYRATAEHGYALRRRSAARTRARSCSGVSGGGVGAGAGFTAAGAAGFAIFFPALRAAN